MDFLIDQSSGELPVRSGQHQQLFKKPKLNEKNIDRITWPKPAIPLIERQ